MRPTYVSGDKQFDARPFPPSLLLLLQFAQWQATWLGSLTTQQRTTHKHMNSTSQWTANSSIEHFVGHAAATTATNNKNTIVIAIITNKQLPRVRAIETCFGRLSRRLHKDVQITHECTRGRAMLLLRASFQCSSRGDSRLPLTGRNKHTGGLPKERKRWGYSQDQRPTTHSSAQSESHNHVK